MNVANLITLCTKMKLNFHIQFKHGIQSVIGSFLTALTVTKSIIELI